MLTRGYKVEITERLQQRGSAATVAQWIGCFNVVRNQKINNGYLNSSNKYTASYAHIKHNPALKFLKDVPPEILRSAGYRLGQEYSAYRQGIRKQPRPSNRNDKRYCYVTKELFKVRPTSATTSLLYLLKSGKYSDRNNLLLTLPRPFPAASIAQALTLTRAGERYWLSISHEIAEPDPVELERDVLGYISIDNIVGNDLGMNRLITDSAGYQRNREASRAAAIARKKLGRARFLAKLARKKSVNDKRTGTSKRPRSNAEQRLGNRVRKLDGEIARIKRDCSHQISKEVAAAGKVIVFEGMSIKALIKRRSRGSKAHNEWLHDCNLGQLRDYSQYKVQGGW